MNQKNVGSASHQNANAQNPVTEHLQRAPQQPPRDLMSAGRELQRLETLLAQQQHDHAQTVATLTAERDQARSQVDQSRLGAIEDLKKSHAASEKHLRRSLDAMISEREAL